MTLKAEVDAKRREISSENLSMSIGELLNLYRDDELDIHPAFQRIFRWDAAQKSRLIESVLLGIPLPSVYVATNEEGVWEVVDGVQRLSTIFEFMGELHGPPDDEGNTELLPPMALSATKHLGAMQDLTWKQMETTLQLEFKRARLDIKILGREGDSSGIAKFDLFERLNTYGTPLSPQELRNCILVSLSLDTYCWLDGLSKNEEFRNCTLLTEAQLEERYDMDLAMRFLTLADARPQDVVDIHEYLRDRIEDLVTLDEAARRREEGAFLGVFGLLDAQLGGDAFRPWRSHLQAFRGAFSLGAFEGLALAMGRHWSALKKAKDKFDCRRVVEALWKSKEYEGGFSGLRARDRMVRVMARGEAEVLKELKRHTRAVPKPSLPLHPAKKVKKKVNKKA